MLAQAGFALDAGEGIECAGTGVFVARVLFSALAKGIAVTTAADGSAYAD